MITQQILSQHPNPAGNLDALVTCINACFECEQCCVSCADACLAEEQVGMLRRCIRLNLDCADVCGATGRILSRQTEPDLGLVRSQLEACRTACQVCAEECDRHAEKHEHCRTCADCCRRCAEACEQLLGTIPQATA